MRSRRTTFRNARGEKLVGVWHGLPGDVAALCSHGLGSSKEGPKHRWVADALEARGIATLRFDYAGCGESEGRLFDLTWSRRLEDLQAAIEHAASLGARRMLLFGSSLGGSMAYLAAARDERIVAIATVGAVARTGVEWERYPNEAQRWYAQGYIDVPGGKIGLSFLDDAATHDVLSAVRVLLAPILVLHGEEDEVVPPADAHDIATAARRARLELLPGADHRLTNPRHRRAALRMAVEFLAGEAG